MSHRVWWLIAFWALAVGMAIELQSPASAGKDEAQAATRAAPTPVAVQGATTRRG